MSWTKNWEVSVNQSGCDKYYNIFSQKFLQRRKAHLGDFTDLKRDLTDPWKRPSIEIISMQNKIKPNVFKIAALKGSNTSYVITEIYPSSQTSIIALAALPQW